MRLISLIYLIILGIGIVSGIAVVIALIRKKWHIHENLLYMVIDGTIEQHQHYHPVMKHLSTCQACRDRLNQLAQGKDLIEHLVE